MALTWSKSGPDPVGPTDEPWGLRVKDLGEEAGDQDQPAADLGDDQRRHEGYAARGRLIADALLESFPNTEPLKMTDAKDCVVSG